MIDSLTALRELRLLDFIISENPNSMIAVRGLGKTGVEAYIIGKLRKDADDIVHLEVDSTMAFLREISSIDESTDKAKWGRYHSPPFVQIKNLGNYDNEFVCPASLVLASTLSHSSNHIYLKLLNDFIHLQTATDINDIDCVQSIRDVQWRGCMHFVRIPADSKRLGAMFEKSVIQREYVDAKDFIPNHNPVRFLFDLNQLSGSEKIHGYENSLQPERDVPENGLSSMDSLGELIKNFQKRPENKYIVHTIRMYGDIEYGGQRVILRIQYPIHPLHRSEIEIRFSVPGSEYPLLRLKDKEALNAIRQFGILESLQVDNLLNPAPKA